MELGRLIVLMIGLAVTARGLAAPSAASWRSFTKVEGLGDNNCVSVSVGAGGNVLVTHSNASTVSSFDGYEITKYPTPDTRVGRLYESPGGQLWAIAPEGLFEYRDTNWITHRLPEIRGAADAPISLLPVRRARVLVLTASQLLRFDADIGLEVLQTAERLRIGGFRGMTAARDGGLWISGELGLVKLTGPFRSLKRDSEANEFIPPASHELRNFSMVQEYAEGGISVLTETKAGGRALAGLEGDRWTVRAMTLPDVRFAWRGMDRLWLVAGRALYEWPDASNQPHPVADVQTRAIADVAVEPEGPFWLATIDGLLHYAPMAWRPYESTSSQRPVAARPIPGLPEDVTSRGDWTISFTSRNGDLWLGGAQGIGWRHRIAWQFFSSTNQIGPEQIVGFAESPDGQMVCATPDKVWQFDGRNWNTARAGFERINGLCYARDGTLWVAAGSSVYRYVRGAWLQSEPGDGLPAGPTSDVREERDGEIIVTTAAGEYAFKADVDRDPPKTMIYPSLAAGAMIHEGTPVKIDFDGRDKWGITRPNQLLYSHRLDEREWSQFQQSSSASFSDLSLGKHVFQVRAMDHNANIDPQPARFEFAVALPWYRETRLVWILSIALVVALLLAALAFNRHRRLQHSYADVERQVAERTRELELANRELLHSQKMNALGTLAAGIAHDFNNILSIVKGSSQIIEENLEQPEKIRTRLDRIKLVVQQGAGIVEAMLGFSRTSETGAVACNVNSVVEDTVKLLGDRFIREIDVRFERAEGLPEIFAARDYVQQVLLNFIFNAQEAMERQQTAGKQIMLQTRLVDTLPSGMVLSPISAGSWIGVSVKDSGSGIPADVLPRIFEPFFTTKAMSARRGTGLGLSMVYELAKKLEAGLTVQTTAGQGSTFTIYLPVRSAPGNQSEAKR